MIAEVMKPMAPPATPLRVRSSHSPMVCASVPRLSRSDSTEICGVWNGNLPSSPLTVPMALSPRALRSAVRAHSAAAISIREICTVAIEMTVEMGMTTVANAASTVTAVASPPLNLSFSRLYSGANR